MKRVLASILCATVALSSQSFSGTALAAETSQIVLSEDEEAASENLSGSEPDSGEPVTDDAGASGSSDADENDGTADESENEETGNSSEEALEDGTEIEPDDVAESGEEDMSEAELLSADESAGSTDGDALSTSYSVSFPDGFEGMVDDGAVTSESSKYPQGAHSGEEAIELLSGESAAEGDVLLDITGTYHTLTAEKILDQVNKIRKEACEQGIIYDGKALTMADYVPLKWSANLEAATRKRAMESDLYIGHRTLSGSLDVGSYIDRSTFGWVGENLAWNNNHDSSGITYGINQFYGEKDDYIKSTKGESYEEPIGHYKNLINPNFDYVGVAACVMSGAPKGWICVAMQLGGKSSHFDGEVDETKDSSSGKLTQTLSVNKNYVSSIAVSGSDTVPKGGTAEYSLSGKISLSSGGYGNVSAAYTLPSGTERGVIWESSDESVATVDGGVVSGISGGTATISATMGEKTATKDIVVTTPIEKISLFSEELSDGALDGKEFNLEKEAGKAPGISVKYYPEDATDEKKVTFSSSNDNIASVEDGELVVKNAGTATITATAKTSNPNMPTVSAAFTVSVAFHIDKVTLDRNSLQVYRGEIYELIAEVIPEDDSAEVTFTSSDESVVKVGEKSGVLTAVSVGSATITASCDGKSADCIVRVIASEVLDGDEPMEGESKDGIWLAANSFNESIMYTGAALTQPDLRFYYGHKRLAQKTDYTLSYKNNTNAATALSANAPQVTATFKGQYQGTQTYKYTIEQVDISEDGGLVTAKETALIYNGKAQKAVPELFYGSAKLKANTDFSCEYEGGDDYTSVGKHKVLLTGKGNYTGEREVSFTITDAGKSLAKATVTVKSANAEDKKIYFRDGLSADDLSATVKIGKDTVPSEYYDVTDLPAKVGAGTITVVSSKKGMEAGYYGYKTVKITSYADREIKNAKVTGVPLSVIFDPVSNEQEIAVTYDEEKLTEGSDYRVSYASAKKVGTAKLTVEGLGRYSGKATYRYKILPKTTGLVVSVPSEMNYVKGGVTPAVTVRDEDGNELKSGTDFSISVKSRSNLKVGTMTFTVVGKGNYKGYTSDEKSVVIKSGNLSDCSMVLADKAFSAKVNSWKSSVKITDVNGKTLSAGTDYDKKIAYAYDGMDQESVPQAGTTVYVTAVGKGNYKGTTITGSYRIYKTPVSKLTVVVDSMEYTGGEVRPLRSTKENPDLQIHIYPSAKDAKAGTNEILVSESEIDDTYRIVGYSSNIKTGTGKVTIRGMGDYGGTRTVNFKILKKSYRK
ncbi:MAG: Ig-like domain-containing protein [Butyrivibrio sp.]|nr:Ig-like domain-containing protein [Butyrivibrio sp.]